MGGWVYLVDKLDEGFLQGLVKEGVLLELGIHHRDEFVVQGKEGLEGWVGGWRRRRRFE